MPTGLENRVQTDAEGPRYVCEADYEGSHVTVATGYDVTRDRWPFHILIAEGKGVPTRISEVPTQFEAHSMSSAFDQGFELAKQHLSRPTGFQTQVREDLRRV